MATTANRPVSTRRTSFTRSVLAGAFAGLGGGIVFGLLMAVTGMLPTIGEVFGVKDAVPAFFAHLFVSAFIGAAYGIVARPLPLSKRTHLVAGLLNGLFWWVVGGLVMIPIGLGEMDLMLKVGSAQLMSLVGHILYGIVTGVLFVPIIKKM